MQPVASRYTDCAIAAPVYVCKVENNEEESFLAANKLDFFTD
jgi:hypothetical protein